MTTGKVAERDAELAHEITLSGNSRYFDPTLSDKITAALTAVRQEEREVFSAALVLNLQAKADALDVRQETECPSGTAFSFEALLRRQVALEVAEFESAKREK